MKCNECNEDMELFKEEYISIPYYPDGPNGHVHVHDYILQYFKCKTSHLFVQAIKRDRYSELSK